MLVGYARTSTVDQEYGLDAQLLALSERDHVFSERASSVGDRPHLEEALSYVRKGDTLVVTKLDRLARSVHDLLGIKRRLDGKGVGLKIIDLSLDTSTPVGKLMMTMLGAVAEFERTIMLERQREGIARAKAEGKYKGRKPTANAKRAQVKALKKQGLEATEIAKEMNIGRASV